MKDHLGNEFRCVTDMCKFHNISYETFIYRMDKGWSIEDALTTPESTKFKRIKDHLGNEFDSERDMCKHYGASYSKFRKRKGRGKSIEECLRVKTNEIEGKGIKIEDHLGNKFKSKRSLCRHWKINYYVFIARERRGWSMKDILETPVKEHKH